MYKKILDKPEVLENPFTVYEWFDDDPFRCDPRGHQVTPHEDVWSDYLLRPWDEEELLDDAFYLDAMQTQPELGVIMELPSFKDKPHNKICNTC